MNLYMTINFTCKIDNVLVNYLYILIVHFWELLVICFVNSALNSWWTSLLTHSSSMFDCVKSNFKMFSCIKVPNFSEIEFKNTFKICLKVVIKVKRTFLHTKFWNLKVRKSGRSVQALWKYLKSRTVSRLSAKCFLKI
jgi:hypothetical protein